MYGNVLASYPGSNYAGEGKRAWYLPFAREKRSARIREDRRTPRKSVILHATTRIIIACNSRKMLNNIMRFYIVIFAFFRRVYTRTRGIPRRFFAINCAYFSSISAQFRGPCLLGAVAKFPRHSWEL